MTDRFWMVWNPNGNTPRYQHPSRGAAEREAMRLYAIAPAQTFYVLEAVAEYTAAVPPVKVTDLRSGATAGIAIPSASETVNGCNDCRNSS